MASSRVSTLELFFDLVFVFTVTQVALIVEDDPTWPRVAQAVLELAAIFWMCGGFAWLTNVLGTQTARQRLVILTGMAAFLVTSLALPRAFSDDAKVFGVAYGALTLVHLAGFLLRGSATFAAMLRVGAANLFGAALILIAGFVGGSARWPLWIAAVAILYLYGLLTSNTESFDIAVEHFAERHGLMILIVLGESLVSVAVAAQSERVTAALIVGALCGLAATAALWWAYFGGEDEAAAEAFAALPPQQRGNLALAGYDLPHLAMIGGILGIAAGSRLSLPDLTSTTSTAAAALIGGGAALFLLAMAAFRFALRYRTALPRAVTGLLALATIPIGTEAGAAQQLAVVAALTAALVVSENRRWAVSGLRAPTPAEPDRRYR
jgi:low temperature requirement protein LtrA